MAIRSNRPYPVIASITLNRHVNENRPVVLNAAAGLTVTLPASSGSGATFDIIVGTTITSNTIVIQVANATDVMQGGVFINDTGDTTAATSDFYPTASTSDTITLTASVGAGKAGDRIRLTDYATGFWAVEGYLAGELDPVSPFSAAVS